MHIGKCKNCGIEKEYKYKSTIRDFCSHKCSNIYKWKHTIEKAKVVTIKCKECGVDFEKHLSFILVHKNTSFCSRKCYLKNIKCEKSECLFCRKEYEKKRSSSRFCSKKCVYDSRKNGYDEKKYMVEYLKKYNILNRKILNKKKRLYNQTENGKASKSAIRQKRRSAGNVTKEDINKIIIYSKYKCYWCGTYCKNDYNIDHYIPIANGGKSNYDNLVLSCRKCNLDKRAKDPQVYANSIGRLI